MRLLVVLLISLILYDSCEVILEGLSHVAVKGARDWAILDTLDLRHLDLLALKVEFLELTPTIFPI